MGWLRRCAHVNHIKISYMFMTCLSLQTLSFSNNLPLQTATLWLHQRPKSLAAIKTHTLFERSHAAQCSHGVSPHLSQESPSYLLGLKNHFNHLTSEIERAFATPAKSWIDHVTTNLPFSPFNLATDAIMVGMSPGWLSQWPARIGFWVGRQWRHLWWSSHILHTTCRR